MRVATQDLPQTAAHPFYARLNQILDQHDFDRHVEGLSASTDGDGQTTAARDVGYDIATGFRKKSGTVPFATSFTRLDSTRPVPEQIIRLLCA